MARYRQVRQLAAQQQLPAGHASYPLNEFSITLGMKAVSVPSGQLQRLKAWADTSAAEWYAMLLKWGVVLCICMCRWVHRPGPAAHLVHVIHPINGLCVASARVPPPGHLQGPPGTMPGRMASDPAYGSRFWSRHLSKGSCSIILQRTK